MKKMKTAAVLLISIVVVMAMSSGSAFAKSTTITGEANFDGSEITSTFSSDEITDAFNDLQPGDDITVEIKYQNDYDEPTDWYMGNEVLQTLEKTNAAKKVEGTGSAENGGYTYELIHTDKNGKKSVLFSNEKVGGEAKPANMEGLEQATNALDEWFYIQTLGKNESGKLKLHVKFDGETEVNDYMDTDGGVMIKFAVELSKSETPPTNPDKPKYRQGQPGTGDMVWFGLFVLMMAAGIVMMILLLKRRKREEGGEA